jgi:predicted metal-binding protein
MGDIGPTGRATVLVCITCRTAADLAVERATPTGDGTVPSPTSDAPRPGLRLAEAAAAAAAGTPDISVRRVRCLGNCNRGLSAAIRCDDAWTYVFGGLEASRDGVTLITGARLLAGAADGIMPWRERPEPLKRGLIARIPPAAFVEEST